MGYGVMIHRMKCPLIMIVYDSFPSVLDEVTFAAPSIISITPTCARLNTTTMTRKWHLLCTHEII